MFVDIVKIYVKAGNGGDGRVNFHREKYVAAGGPDGGDGGHGGNIVFEVDNHLSTLLDFRMKRKYIGNSGEIGGTKNSTGKTGADTVIKVPRGTLVRDRDSEKLMCDMTENERFVVAKGGRGGWGNARFATPTRQAPRFAKPGLAGEERELILELKLIADVGLIGFPNVGKSTLLSVISRSRPKIANYHFTTLSPNLGVVYVEDGASFVCADIPGIIEGASEGTGLGLHFLRHIERCRLLVHMIDVSGSEGREVLEDLKIINSELKNYSAELSKRPQIIVANKSDILEDDTNLNLLRDEAERLGCPFYQISAATSMGLRELIFGIWQELEKLPLVESFEAEFVPEALTVPLESEVEIEVVDNIYYIKGPFIEHLMKGINFDEYESRMYFEKVLKRASIYDMLEKAGIQEKDLVDACGMQFEYIF